MTLLFWAHAAIVAAGLVVCAINLYDAYLDIRSVRDADGPAARDAIIVAYGWLVRSGLKALILLTFASFIAVFLSDPTHRAGPEWTTFVEMRAVWISGFVLVLAAWDKAVRAKLRR